MYLARRVRAHTVHSFSTTQKFAEKRAGVADFMGTSEKIPSRQQAQARHRAKIA